MSNIQLPNFKVDAGLLTNNPLDNPEIHIVATALKKSGFCISFLGRRGMTVSKVSEFCDVVNKHDDVGSLYPKVQLSLFPIYSGEHQEPEDQKLRRYVSEILKSHKYFTKAKSILFVFDTGSGYDLSNLTERLESILHTFPESGNIQFYVTTY
jgi:hypothetical protein